MSTPPHVLRFARAAERTKKQWWALIEMLVLLLVAFSLVAALSFVVRGWLGRDAGIVASGLAGMLFSWPIIRHYFPHTPLNWFLLDD